MQEDKKNIKWRMLHDMPINTKLLLSILVCVFLPFFVVNILSYTQLNDNIRENLQTQIEHSVNIAAEKIRRQFSEAIALGDFLIVDKALISRMQQNYQTDLDYYIAYTETIYPMLDQYSLLHPNYTAIHLYTNNPTVLSGGGVYSSLESNRFDSDVNQWYEIYKRDEKSIALINYFDSKGQQLSLIYKLSRAGTPYAILLKVDFSAELFRDMLQTDIENAQLILVDENDEVVCSSLQQNTDLAAFSDHLSQEASVSLGDRMGWQVKGVILNEELLSSTAAAKWRLILIMLLGVCATIMLYRIMYRSYFKRINQLLAHMQMVRAQQFVPIEQEDIGSDEIGQLMRGYNEMTNEISRLIHDVYMLDADKKSLEIENMRAELLNMQSQMDPHFMYNTLSAMMVVSMKENYPKLVDIIYYLSRLLRRMVDRTDHYVSIHEEIVFTEMYLRIENFRFRDQFSYEIDVQPEAEDWSIPKFSIQPLVENACKHGIHARLGIGRVCVKVYIDDRWLWIRVRDNGSGFTPEQLKKTIKEMTDTQTATSSIGLRNIYMRLHNDFRDDFSMEINSKENEGTEITLRLPLDQMKKSENHFDIPLEPGGGIFNDTSSGSSGR